MFPPTQMRESRELRGHFALHLSHQQREAQAPNRKQFLEVQSPTAGALQVSPEGL